ncbi:MAG: ABC transporter permease [Terriglobia bacterium]
MGTILQDLKYGLRMLAKNPGFTAVAVLTLALGIGANTAMFSVVNAVLLRPLSYKDPARLVSIWAGIPSVNISGAFVEYNTFAEYWRAESHSFQSMVAYSPSWVNMTSVGGPERVFAYRVNAGFLSMIGVKPEFGREFSSAEDQPGAPRVAMVSHRLWMRRFGGDSALMGGTIVLDRNSYTVVGILPANFDFYDREADLYMPIAASTARAAGMPSVGVNARLKPGVSVETAQTEIDGLSRRWVQATNYPKDWGARVWRVRDYAVREVRLSVVVLAVAVGLVLLIACANVANLLLARAAARQREVAIRSALGVTPGRIVGQLLSESALLGLVAGALGLLAAWGGVRALAAGPGYLPFQDTITIDAPVLWFTLGAALLTILLFGLAPGLAAAHTRLAENLQDGGRTGEGKLRARLREALVVSEVALALLLAIGATLTARSLIRLQAVDPGFNADGVLTAYLTLPEESYAKPGQRVSFFRAAVERIRTLPNVKAASMVSHLPFSYSKSGGAVTIEGAPPLRPGEKLIVFERSIDPDYFWTMGVRLLRGRFFDGRDPDRTPVAIINEAMARRCWPNQDPVGKRFGDGKDHWATVVGVVANMRQTSLVDEPDMESYVPYRQSPGATMGLVIRTAMDPLRLTPTLRAAVGELDRELPVSDIGTLVGNIARSTRERRFTVALFGAFALLSLVLAAVGIYGVIAYSVARRTHEIGVRMALGAERGRIVGMVVGQAVLLGGVGVAIGIAGALALTRLLRSILYGVSATDPVAFISVSLFLLLVAALAGYVPARRAAKVDPMVALRHE